MATAERINEVTLQRQYYKATAHQYNAMHVDEDREHGFALAFLATAIDFLDVKSVLDVGSGTGRALLYLKERHPSLRLVGIEPVAELRAIGHANGLTPSELIDGDVTNLPFADGEFDLVCEFAVLHHVRRPAVAVRQMLRTSRRAIFISDSNNFGQGSWSARTAKQLLNGLGLWRLADRIKTRGKGYSITEGDGLSYSYSVFNNFAAIQQACSTVHVLNTEGNGANPYRTASHVALFGIKGVRP